MPALSFSPRRRRSPLECRGVRRAFAPLGALLVLAGIATAPRALADPPAAPPTATATARKEALEHLAHELRKFAGGTHAEQHREDIEKTLDALDALGGADGAAAAIDALAFDDEATEKRVMTIVETVHDKSLGKPLANLVEHKDYRRRFRLHVLVAHALSVIADVDGIPPLTALVDSEDAKVIAAAGDALATFKTAPHSKRVEAVRHVLDRFETTWNLKESRRPEDKIATERAKSDWEVFGASLKKTLQALTGQAQLVRPKQFRDWWNDNKKATNW